MLCLMKSHPHVCIKLCIIAIWCSCCIAWHILSLPWQCLLSGLNPRTFLQVQSILKPTHGVTWPSGKPENEGGYGAIFLDN